MPAFSNIAALRDREPAACVHSLPCGARMILSRPVILTGLLTGRGASPSRGQNPTPHPSALFGIRGRLTPPRYTIMRLGCPAIQEQGPECTEPGRRLNSSIVRNQLKGPNNVYKDRSIRGDNDP